MHKHAISRLTWILSGTLLLGAGPAQAYVIMTYSDAAYSASESTLNSNVGVAGYGIEDFEDSSLIAGLSISTSGMYAGYPQYPGSRCRHLGRRQPVHRQQRRRRHQRQRDLPLCGRAQ